MGGWTPATVTVNADGTIQAVTVTQSRFTPGCVEDLLASRRAENEPRGRHGYTLAEATDPKHQYEWVTGLPVTDFVQASIDRAKKKYRDDYPDADMDSLLWMATRA